VTVYAEGQRLLDRFVLLEPLGQGGQAEAWRALDEQRAAQVALEAACPPCIWSCCGRSTELAGAAGEPQRPAVLRARGR
jgi:hypothetical protein